MHDTTARNAEIHKGPSRKVYDLKHSRRNSGEMFFQLMFGQRIQVDGGSDVWKFSMITFTLPDIHEKGKEIFNAIIEQNRKFSGLAESVQSFNSQESLLGAFGQSSEPITRDDLNALFRALQTVENTLVANKHLISEEALDGFLLKRTKYMMNAEAIIGDSESILTNPEHGGAVAFGNSKEFGDAKLYRMEVIRQNGQAITRGTPTEDYKIRAYDETVVKDNKNGDRDFMIMVGDHMESADKSGARSIFIGQANWTSTVSDCAGNDAYVNKYDHSANSQVQNNTVQTFYTSTDPNSLAAVAQSVIQAAAATAGSGTSSGGTGDPGSTNTSTKAPATAQLTAENNTSTHSGGAEEHLHKNITDARIMCPNCGRMNDHGVPICSCMMRGLKNGNETVLIQSHHHR